MVICNIKNFKKLKINYIQYSDINKILFDYFLEIYKLLYDKSIKFDNNNTKPKTGIELEEEVSIRLKKIGYKTKTTKISGDQGVDVIAIKNNITLAIQCKLYSKPVGNKAVQEIIAGKDFYNADYGIVISNAEFTKSAKELANKCNIKLINFRFMEDEIKKII